MLVDTYLYSYFILKLMRLKQVYIDNHVEVDSGVQCAGKFG